MLKSIIKSSESLIAKYIKEGVDVLVNCSDQTEYAEIIANLKLLEIVDLGLRKSDFEENFRNHKVSYYNIIEDNNMSIGVFCLAKGAQLSLHDHPNMMVLSKLLCGKIKRKTMDLIDRSHQVTLAKNLYIKQDINSLGTILEAKIDSEKIFESGDILQLTPDKGNIHSFEAVEDTAILDILLPNYDNQDRFCNYYLELDANTDFSISTEVEEGTTEGELIISKKAEASLGKKSEGGTDNADQTIVKLAYSLPPIDFEVKIIEYKGDVL